MRRDPARGARAPRRCAGGARERRARRDRQDERRGKEEKTAPTPLLDCGGENHLRFTRSRVVRRSARAAPSLHTKRRSKRRHETRTTSDDEEEEQKTTTARDVRPSCGGDEPPMRFTRAAPARVRELPSRSPRCRTEAAGRVSAEPVVRLQMGRTTSTGEFGGPARRVSGECDAQMGRPISDVKRGRARCRRSSDSRRSHGLNRGNCAEAFAEGLARLRAIVGVVGSARANSPDRRSPATGTLGGLTCDIEVGEELFFVPHTGARGSWSACFARRCPYEPQT